MPALRLLAALGAAVVIACLPAAAQAQSGADIPVPPGLPFQVSKVPNLERDCGPQANSSPVIPADPKALSPAAANPLAADRFFVDPTERSYKELQIYRSRGQTAKATAMERLALVPKAHWMGNFTRPNMTHKVRNYLNCVQVFSPGATPLLVVMRHQGKECNPHYTAGGKAEDARTRAWYDNFARAVGNSRVVIAYEPDSIGTISCLAKSRRKARRDVLRYGVDVLSKLPNATIYLEGTASDWKSPAYTAGLLRYIGIAKVRGFMLNVTHHDWTANNIAYGRKVSRRVGGKPFVVSTSYNGRGPVHYKLGKKGRYRRVNVYCNPRFRGLGPSPRTTTGIPGVDGFLYLNRPGVSGAGSCNGGFQAGKWWASRGLMYATYATEMLGPPRGSRFGFPFRISLCKLGAPVQGENSYSRVSPEKRCH